MKNFNVVFDILIHKSINLVFFCINKDKIIFRLLRQGSWTRADFRRFLGALFSNKKRPYCILSDLVEQYFRETDFNEVKEQCVLFNYSSFSFFSRTRKLILMNFYKHGRKQ